MKRLNQKGSILIISYMVLYVLLALAAGFAITNYSELFFARRYQNTAAAFWLAEAGISRYLQNPAILDSDSAITINMGPGIIHLKKDDSSTTKRAITSTGVIKGISKSLQIEYLANPPEIFNNSISVNGDISLLGQKASFTAFDRIRLSGKIKDESKYSNVFWEDLREGFNPGRLQTTFPDVNKNGKSDEFEDFVGFYRNLLDSYPRDQVVYLSGEGTYTLTPDKELNDKKIIFVDGKEGEGDVLIQFNGSWEKGQTLTVVSTGTVTFNQGGEMPADSQLNIISWTGYRETAVFPTIHNGVIYTHGVAQFDNIFDSSVTNGCVIAQGGINFGEVWSTKIFKYADVRKDGILPLGFQGMASGRTPGYSDKPQVWKEI